MCRIARVQAGQQVNIAWTLNTHIGNVSFFFEGRNAPADGATPTVQVRLRC